ncbi:MAG: DUF2330 domain-containing protein [Polyangiaceae bacterium]
MTPLLAAGATLLAAPKEAAACGGCFAPQDPPTVVSGHRMALAVSMEHTVLWDSIQYSGEPAEFAWVLPVKPGARVEAATAAFFEVLEGQSAVRIVPPMLDCGGGSSGVGCGATLAAAEDDSGGGGFSNGGQTVDVVHQGTVGPYETVTLSTETPGALNTWLDQHGYNVDPTTQPIIDGYVAEGFDFIALRLQPGKGISQMTPVRVIMPAGSATLPLRMVGIGTGALTPVVLYVIGEGRYTVKNFDEITVPTTLLSWNFKTEESNYAELRDSALARNGGENFLTAYAAQGIFNGGYYYDESTGASQSLAQLYVSQAAKNGEIPTACTLPASYGSGRVVNPCPPGEPWDSPACGAAPSGNLDARDFGCPGAEDVSVALEGQYLSSVWVTRLEAVLPRTAFNRDLELQAAEEQDWVSNYVTANIALEAEGQCPSGIIPRTIKVDDANNRRFTTIGSILGAAALALGLRRRSIRKAKQGATS